MKNKILFNLIFAIILSQNIISAFLISDQGTNVREVTTGNLVELANLTISIYDNLNEGNLIFEQNFSNIIVNGSWNVIINPDLEYGKNYYKDYSINGEDLDFDGNERLHFQSSVGKLNNVSFINFSLINSCPSGSSIRLIYENGSVECEMEDSSGTMDLTNYALKNQSETFVGNITTSQTGFFGWLGSVMNRVTKLFVQNIDFNGTINGSGNINITGNISANYFIGDGSQLTNLPEGNESDPIFSMENSSLWNAINSKLTETDQKYNETTLILSINTTSNIMNLDFYNKSEINNLISMVNGGNSSFNQTLTDTLYYKIDNPFNYYNLSDFNINDYYLKSNPYSFYNSTSLQNLSQLIDDLGNRGYTHLTNFTDNILWTTTFNTTGDSRWLTSYTEIDPYWTANQSSYFTKSDILNFNYYNLSDFNINDYYLKSNPFNFWNDTYATFNKTYADTLYCQLTGCNITGNITSQTGFFTYLGSLTNKITKLFTQEIETEKINISNKLIIKDNVTSNYTEMYSYNGTFYIDLY